MFGTEAGEFIPETLLLKPSKVSRREVGHVVKPFGKISQSPNTSNVTLPKKRAKPLTFLWNPSNRANVQHRPVKQVAIRVFPMLVHVMVRGQAEQLSIPKNLGIAHFMLWTVIL